MGGCGQPRQTTRRRKVSIEDNITNIEIKKPGAKLVRTRQNSEETARPRRTEETERKTKQKKQRESHSHHTPSPRSDGNADARRRQCFEGWQFLATARTLRTNWYVLLPPLTAAARCLGLGPPQERRTSSFTGWLAAIQGRALHCTGREAGDLQRHSIPCHSRHNA